MSTTTTRDHGPSRDDRAEEYETDPGKYGLVLPLIGLVLVVLGDFANFNIALQRSFPTMSPVIGLLLTAAMTAAAVLLMYEAGKAAARRRTRNIGRTGIGAVGWRLFAWLMLGATAFALRMAAPPEVTTSGGFGQSTGFGSGQTGGFGDGAASSTELFAGPLTLHTENITSALALLAIFIAGGVGAFWFGREHHNPVLSDVLRSKRRARNIRTRRNEAHTRYEAGRAQADVLAAAYDQHQFAQAQLMLLDQLEHEVGIYESTVSETRRYADRIRLLDAELADAQAELAALPDLKRLDVGAAAHAGEEAKVRARVLLKQYRLHAAEHASAVEQHQLAHAQLMLLDQLEQEVALYERAVEQVRQHNHQIGLLDSAIADAQAELTALPALKHLDQAAADHAGDEAKGHARVLLAQHRGTPAASTGLPNGADQ